MSSAENFSQSAKHQLLLFLQGLMGQTVHACGTTVPPVFDSVGRTVQINYAVTASGSTGFSLTYKLACKFLLYPKYSDRGF